MKEKDKRGVKKKCVDVLEWYSEMWLLTDEIVDRTIPNAWMEKEKLYPSERSKVRRALNKLVNEGKVEKGQRATAGRGRKWQDIWRIIKKGGENDRTREITGESKSVSEASQP